MPCQWLWKWAPFLIFCGQLHTQGTGMGNLRHTLLSSNDFLPVNPIRWQPTPHYRFPPVTTLHESCMFYLLISMPQSVVDTKTMTALLTHTIIDPVPSSPLMKLEPQSWLLVSGVGIHVWIRHRFVCMNYDSNLIVSLHASRNSSLEASRSSGTFSGSCWGHPTLAVPTCY